MAKKKTQKRRQAVRDNDRRLLPAWIWLTFGILLGLGLAVLLTVTGIMPQPKDVGVAQPVPTRPPVDLNEEIAQPGGGRTEEEWKPRYDFYTVLPEMEVVVPEAELQERAKESEDQRDEDLSYVLQVGSFRQFADADRIKAQLALQGVIGHVRSVEINGSTWHRVRVGPYTSSRETDVAKRQLQNSGFEVIVLTERS